MSAIRFRKRPVVIEAFNTTWPLCDWPEWAPKPRVLEAHGLRVVESVLEIPTLEGVMVARWGDWVIRGVAGEIYPCKPEIFAATYEPADPEGQVA